jgi:hypothetical protein
MRESPAQARTREARTSRDSPKLALKAPNRDVSLSKFASRLFLTEEKLYLLDIVPSFSEAVPSEALLREEYLVVVSPEERLPTARGRDRSQRGRLLLRRVAKSHAHEQRSIRPVENGEPESIES